MENTAKGTKLAAYARLLIQVGLNVQKGQRMMLRAPVECADFARLCAEAAYDAGAREVVVDWSDDALSRLHFLHADDAAFDECPAWVADKFNTLAKEGAAFLSIYATDPDTLKGVSPDRIRRNAQARGKAMQPYRDAQMRNEARWCVASVPIPSWAQKVFPDKTGADAMDALWDAIFQTLHMAGGGDPVALWREQAARMRARCERLNALDLASLHYQNSLGTDLVIELPEGAIWLGGAEDDPHGVSFMPNLPTEEIFTAPRRDGVNGTVVSSMPFSLHGNVIDRFTLTLKKGKIVGIKASTPEEEAVLTNAISVDEGASYLGEVALVPYDSPIRRLNILFFNTLFDENASCHLAFGEAYPCLAGAAAMTKEELTVRGINDSIAHEDFMVGTGDLSIMGRTRDGREVSVFVDGNFAF